MRINSLAVLGLTLLILLSGCARSFNAEYKAELAPLSNAATFDKITVGIAKFEDKRTLLEANNPQSESYVLRHGPNKVGITYKNKEFMPVKDVIQDILFQEMTKSGFKIKTIDKVLSNSNSQHIEKQGETQTADYILGGQILSFESAIQTGFVTVTNNKTVILNINLFRSKDMQLVLDIPITATESKEYAVGLAIPVAINNLVNETMKIAASQVVQKVAEKITFEQKQTNN